MSEATGQPDTAIIVPCYNEAERLRRDAFEAFAAAHPEICFVFVNDGSRDGTSALIHSIADEHPASFTALDQEKNGGKAEAVRAGFTHVMRGEAQFDGIRFIGFWDADLATPLEDITAFRDVLGEGARFDMVFGSRVNLLGRSVNRNLMRHYIGRIFATLADLIIRLPIYDTQCGEKLFRATPELAEIISTPFLSRWIFDVEIVARYIMGRRGSDRPDVGTIIYEFPLMEWTDVAGSKLKANDFMTVGLDLFRIWRRYFLGSPKPSETKAPHVDAVG